MFSSIETYGSGTEEGGSNTRELIGLYCKPY